MRVDRMRRAIQEKEDELDEVNEVVCEIIDELSCIECEVVDLKKEADMNGKATSSCSAPDEARDRA